MNIIYVPIKENIPDFPDLPLEFEYALALSDTNIQGHLDRLYRIALENNGSRSTINGFNASAEYVIESLKEADACDIFVQNFKAPVWTNLGEPTLVINAENNAIKFNYGVDFGYHRYGGSSADIQNSQFVHIKNNACDPSTFPEVKGKVAIIDSNITCTLYEASYALELAGASAILISTTEFSKKLSNARIRTVEWKESDTLVTIPVLSITHSTFLTVLSSSKNTINIVTHSKIEIADTFNVFCVSREGYHNNTIVVGAHLDSVADGPGINDNGSGSSAILEFALLYAKKKLHPKNRIVFAWWGSEEDGLLGSRYFMNELNKYELDGTISKNKKVIKTAGKLKIESNGDITDIIKKKDIVMNLNFDMLGSPNIIPFILDGRSAPNKIRTESITIQKTFAELFETFGLPTILTGMNISTDFIPFMNNGIPVGGLYSGSTEIKHPQIAKLVGGVPDVPADPCYHKPCDTIDNIQPTGFHRLSKSAIYTITKFAINPDLRTYLKTENINNHTTNLNSNKLYQKLAAKINTENFSFPI
ncbi:hypothetical protein BB558_000030 [Smittium angustum]|uniref:Peptide hydrolase n=1 Tax=Smittium angustum TaxID=133377 RepID=A0A2U1JFN8_SMIAN|nr:hypothetical protein BB558_000030 [Smittium angustum]